MRNHLSWEQIYLFSDFRNYVDSSHFGRVIEVVKNFTLKSQQ